jgi:non-ribosomal peptide synthetase component E (peptide arylation enzyme)
MEPLALADLRAFLEGKGLRTQAVPEQLEIVETVPRNPAGKLLKHKLREQLLSKPQVEGRQK